MFVLIRFNMYIWGVKICNQATWRLDSYV